MTRRLKIAFLHPFLFRYARGIERYTLNLANALARRNVEVHLVTWRWHSPIQIDPLDSAVRVHILPTSRYYAAAAVVPFYVSHLLTQRYDFVWIHFAGYGEAEALALARWQRYGIVFHYPLAQAPHRYHEFINFGTARRAAQMVSVSGYVAQGVREFFGRPSPVIPHGVDTVRFGPRSEARARVRASLNLGREDPLLVTAAALEERKGVQWVLRALPQVLRTFPETRYLVMGDGVYKETLESTVRALGLDRHVCLLGAQADVTPFYQAADLSLILSHGEASSLTALESLACGVPVIAAQQPPFDELIEPGYGQMVDAEDATRVAGAITDLLADAARRKAMGEAGRARIQADFTWDRVGEQYVRLLDSDIRD